MVNNKPEQNEDRFSEDHFEDLTHFISQGVRAAKETVKKPEPFWKIYPKRAPRQQGKFERSWKSAWGMPGIRYRSIWQTCESEDSAKSSRKRCWASWIKPKIPLRRKQKEKTENLRRRKPCRGLRNSQCAIPAAK